MLDYRLTFIPMRRDVTARISAYCETNEERCDER
jgi:hypothetical protein